MNQPDSSIRLDVVILLADLNITPYKPLDEWTHLDGRSLTPDEQDIVGSVTPNELEAVVSHFAVSIENDGPAKALARIQELTAPYFARLPKGAVMDDVTPLMTEAERDELNRLVLLVAGATP